MDIILTTRNRKLEQVLYMLGVHHLDCRKDDEGMSVWYYPNTEKVRQIMAWFSESMREHNNRKDW